MASISYAATGDKRIAVAVILALPFILVRLAYSTLAVFVHNHDFNIINGSVAILVVMAVLEEFVVVFIYLFLGFKLDTMSLDQQGPIVSRPWKEPKHQSARRNRHVPQAQGAELSPPTWDQREVV